MQVNCLYEIFQKIYFRKRYLNLRLAIHAAFSIPAFYTPAHIAFCTAAFSVAPPAPALLYSRVYECSHSLRAANTNVYLYTSHE